MGPARCARVVAPRLRWTDRWQARSAVPGRPTADWKAPGRPWAHRRRDRAADLRPCPRAQARRRRDRRASRPAASSPAWPSWQASSPGQPRRWQRRHRTAEPGFQPRAAREACLWVPPAAPPFNVAPRAPWSRSRARAGSEQAASRWRGRGPAKAVRPFQGAPARGGRAVRPPDAGPRGRRRAGTAKARRRPGPGASGARGRGRPRRRGAQGQGAGGPGAREERTEAPSRDVRPRRWPSPTVRGPDRPDSGRSPPPRPAVPSYGLALGIGPVVLPSSPESGPVSPPRRGMSFQALR